MNYVKRELAFEYLLNLSGAETSGGVVSADERRWICEGRNWEREGGKTGIHGSGGFVWVLWNSDEKERERVHWDYSVGFGRVSIWKMIQIWGTPRGG